MAFQQRHYQAIAQLLQDVRAAHDDDAAGSTVLADVERRFINLFRNDNANFNVGLFEQALKPGANVNARRVK